MDEHAAAAHRSLRGQWWLGLTIAWIVGWWIILDNHYEATMAAIVECDPNDTGIGTSLSDLLGIRDCGEDARSRASNDFASEMLVRVCLVIFLFIPAGFLARLQGSMQASSEARADAAATRRAQNASALRIAQAEAAAAGVHRQTARADFLHRLGSVGDLVSLLPGESDPNRINTIRLGVSQKLRDVTSKYTLDDLVQMVRSDEAIRLALSALLKALEGASLNQSLEALLLQQTLQRSIAEAG